MVAARKIRAADRTGEQHVAHQREPMCAAEEHHVARCVAGAVIDLEDFVAELHALAVLQPAVRFERLGSGKAEARALIRQLVEPEAFVGMWAFDRHAVMRGERLGAGAVVDVAVREEHFFDCHILTRDLTLDDIQVAARIDDGRASGCLANEQRAVLLEWRDGDQGDFHG